MAINALDHLEQQGHQLRLVPQNLYKLWVVGTRPKSVKWMQSVTDLVQTLVAKR